MTTDPRYIALRRGIDQLDFDEIQRILDTPDDQILLDGGNYADGKFCPLAIGLGVRDYVWREPPTNEIVEFSIAHEGFDRLGYAFLFNQMKGTPGQFYRDNRAADLKRVCREILEERIAARVG